MNFRNKNKLKDKTSEWKQKAEKVPLLGRLIHNSSLKLLALLFAVIIWSVVMTQTNPPRKKIIYDVPIEVTGLQMLSNRNLALKYTPESMHGFVDVILEVPMNDLSKASADNVTATVDLSRVATTGEHKINLILTSRYGSPVSATYESFTIEVESLQDSSIPVRVKYTGSLDPSLHQGTATVRPAEFNISGPVTEVNRVSYAQVNVNLNSVSESISQSMVFTLYDENGHVVDFDDFNISIGNSVSVSIPIYPVKEIPISYEGSISGHVKDGYVLKSIEAYPKTVKVAAEQSVLDTLTTISTAAFSVEGLEHDCMLSGVALRNLTDVKWMELQEVDLSLAIDEITDTKTFSFVPVSVRNLAEGFVVDTFDARVDVVITAPVSELAALTRNDIHAYLDLSSYGEGQFVDDVHLSIDKLNQYSASMTPDRITFVISAE